jgi:DNA-directed RNA polymerase subunit M/transcription elongation factor TFIIS
MSKQNTSNKVDLHLDPKSNINSASKPNEPKFPNAIPLKFDTFYTDEYSPQRRLKLLLISNVLGGVDKFQKLQYSDQLNMIKEIENGCYQAVCARMVELDLDIDWDNPAMYNSYDYICGNLLQNLDPNSIVSSQYLLNRILNGEIELNKLGKMTSEELCPEKSAEIRNKIAERSDVKSSKKHSTMYRCSKCKKSETTLERRHTRGLDEATNYRATCMFCKHSWNI